jgi:hypothetical protein
MDRHAAELGLTSLIFAAVLSLAVPMTLALAVLVWRFAEESPNVVLLNAWLARVGVALGGLTGVMGVGFGVAGLKSARTKDQPAGLALGGVLLGIIAFVLWTIAAIGLLNTTESLLRLYGN